MRAPITGRKPPGLGPLADLAPAADLPLLCGFSDWLRNGTDHHSPDTVRTYVSHLAVFLRLVPGATDRPLVESVTKPALSMAIAGIPFERMSTRRNTFFAVKALARYLADLDLVDEKTADAIQAMRIKRGSKPTRAHLTREQIEAVLRRILACPRYDDVERLANLTIVSMLALTGLRNTELCLLKVADVDLDGGLIRVVRGKGGKARIVGLPDRLEPLLRAYLEHRPGTSTPYFFVGSTGEPLTRDLVIRRLQRLSAATGIKFTAHALRRSFATDVAHNRGVSLDKLQVVLGHADIVTTRNYVQTSGDAVALEMRGW